MYLNTVYPEGPIKIEDPGKYVGNPLNSLLILKRVGFETQKFNISGFFQNTTNQLKTQVESLNSDMVTFPSSDDYRNAIECISIVR